MKPHNSFKPAKLIFKEQLSKNMKITNKDMFLHNRGKPTGTQGPNREL